MNQNIAHLSWDEMLSVSLEELPELSRVPIQVFETPDDLFAALADEIVDLVLCNNKKGLPTRIAWPVGPKKHHPIIIERTLREQVSWKNTIHYQVDEWLDWQGRKLSPNHPFNLEPWLRREFFGQLPEHLAPPEDNLYFHDPLRIDYIDRMIEQRGGIDLLIGGFGLGGIPLCPRPDPKRIQTNPASWHLGV